MAKPIFQKIPRPEIFDATLRGEPYKMLHIIRQRCGANGECWPSYDRLSLDTGIKDHRTIKTHLKTLQKKGLLDIISQGGKPNILRPTDTEKHYGESNFMRLPGAKPPTKNEGGTDADPLQKMRGVPPTKDVPPPPSKIVGTPPTKDVCLIEEVRLKEERMKEEPPAHAREATPDKTANRIFKLFEQVIATPPLRGSAVDDYEAIEYHLNNLIKKHGFDAIFQKSNEVLTRRGTRIRDIRYLMTADGKGGALANVEWENESEGEERHREIMEMAARMRGSKKRKVRSEL